MAKTKKKSSTTPSTAATTTTTMSSSSGGGGSSTSNGSSSGSSNTRKKVTTTRPEHHRQGGGDTGVTDGKNNGNNLDNDAILLEEAIRSNRQQAIRKWCMIATAITALVVSPARGLVSWRLHTGKGNHPSSTKHRAHHDTNGMNDNDNAMKQFDLENDNENDNDVNNTCRFVMAASTIPNGGFGVYSLAPIPKYQPVLYGEPVIQVPDLIVQRHAGVKFLMHNYAWIPDTTGGQHEGYSVMSVVPGLSMLANSRPDQSIGSDHPRVHHDGLVRGTPGAGSNTHYHNLSKYAYKDIQPGEEIFVDYGRAWDNRIQLEFDFETTRSPEWLQENGMCLDNLKPTKSPGRGHGAVATRKLAKGSIIAPVPVLVVDRESMEMESDDGVPRKQLLLNYCYGHANSSVLLFPYSPAVNLINHDLRNSNAVLRWSDRMVNPRSWFDMTAEQVKTRFESGLLLELVATRNIRPGEEIFIDYGAAYEQAWREHLYRYPTLSPADKGLTSEGYAYAFEVNMKLRQVRTVEEEAFRKTYPPNLVTSCLHMYHAAMQDPNTERHVDPDTGAVTTHAHFIYDRTLFQPHFLRPCHILERNPVPGYEGHYSYKVEVLNRPFGTMYNDEENIPPGERHFVTGLPREALHFADHVGTTDQHLPSAFRHEIGLPEGVFPKSWMDLLG